MCERGLKWLLLLTILGRWSVSHRSIAHIKKEKKKSLSFFFLKSLCDTYSHGNTVIQYSLVHR